MLPVSHLVAVPTRTPEEGEEGGEEGEDAVPGSVVADGSGAVTQRGAGVASLRLADTATLLRELDALRREKSAALPQTARAGRPMSLSSLASGEDLNVAGLKPFPPQGTPAFFPLLFCISVFLLFHPLCLHQCLVRVTIRRPARATTCTKSCTTPNLAL